MRKRKSKTYSSILAIAIIAISAGVAESRFDASFNYKFFRGSIEHENQQTLGLPNSLPTCELVVVGLSPNLTARGYIEIPQQRGGTSTWLVTDKQGKKTEVPISTEYIGSLSHFDVGFPSIYGQLTVEPQISLLSNIQSLTVKGEGISLTENVWTNRVGGGLYVSQRLNGGSQVSAQGIWAKGLSLYEVWIDYYPSNVFFSIGYSHKGITIEPIRIKNDGLAIKVGVMF